MKRWTLLLNKAAKTHLARGRLARRAGHFASFSFCGFAARALPEALPEALPRGLSYTPPVRAGSWLARGFAVS